MISKRIDALEASLPPSGLTATSYEWTDDDGREHLVHVTVLDDERDADHLRAAGVDIEALSLMVLADGRPARVLHFGCCRMPKPLPGSKLARLAVVSAKRGARTAEGREDRGRSVVPFPAAVAPPSASQ
jgi:hypothetical protein